MSQTSRLIDEGRPSARIYIVGEAPGADEVAGGRPFVGLSGRELDKMLLEAGIARSDCFLTNVCHERPPSYLRNGKWIHNDIEQFFLTKTAAAKQGVEAVAGRYPAAPIRDGLRVLYERLREHRPSLIIALGNTPLWALAGVVGITKWRGSVLSTEYGKCIPTFHPADVLRAWTHRPIVVQDFRRCRAEAELGPHVRANNWDFVVPRHHADIAEWFHEHGRDSSHPLVCDTEGWGRVDCIGFAADRTNAICIPFTHPVAEGEGAHYWSAEDELTITQTCRTVLASRPIVFHNALWDCQVIARRWGMMPRLHGDTQVMQHVCFPGLLGGRIDPVTGTVDKKGSSLSLSFIASMYCDNYRFWKDDGRTFDPDVHDERQLWEYNCEDCVRTYECFDVLNGLLDSYNLREQYNIEMQLFAPVLRMMFRGIRYDRQGARAQRAWFGECDRKAGRRTGAIADVANWIDTAVGCDFNPDSTTQMRALFYDDLQLPLIKNRKTGAPTLDDATLDTIARRNPLLRPLVSQIQNYRTLDTLRSSVDPDAVSSTDARLRFALNIGFVETFRFSCNESAFGEGGNLQNIKRPDDD